MGLTKQYLRFVPGAVFNIIASAKSSVVFVPTKGLNDRFVAVGACENIFIWDTRKGEKTAILHGAKAEVTGLVSAPDGRHLAAAYTDGCVRIFQRSNSECIVTFHGHKSQVSCIAYDDSGTRLVSGGKDTEIVVWDVINEAGLFRLRGHKGIVTCCRFLKDRNILISGSKDTFIKLWDLDTQHCFKTLLGHRSEIWDLVLWDNSSRLVTGSADSELRIWKIQYKEDKFLEGKDSATTRIKWQDEEEDNEGNTDICSCVKLGSIMRQGRDHVVSLKLDDRETVLGCHGTDSTLELFKLLTEEEIAKRHAKRMQKAIKKMRLESENTDATEASGPTAIERTIQDEIIRLPTVKATAKIKSFDMRAHQLESMKVVLLLGNNTFECYSLNIATKGNLPQLVSTLHLPGHRTDVRTLTFSSDNTGIISASGESVKIWNRASQQCIRTMPCEYALCSLFVPGDRHCIIGTKSGKLQVFDIAAARLLQSVAAHEGAVWAVCMTANKRGFASGGADKEVKFWDFELVPDSDNTDSRKRLSVTHMQTLKMSEDVLGVKFSADGRLIAVSLLDSTVKIFFTDTLKFFLTLYGHKFPVLCMDISDDSAMIATGSADKNIKIWGLDFGDCHKSIYAHDDSVMCMQFVPKTHLLFSGGKDSKVKLWDLDSYEKISTFDGHHGEIWGLAVSPNGQHVVSASHDKSLRLWEKSQEILVLEEEKEMEREAEYEKGMTNEDEPVIAGETNSEAGLAGKKTLETVAAADKIIDALGIYAEGLKAEGTLKAKTPLHPLLVAYKTPTYDHFMLHVLKTVKSSELEEALLVLPFNNTVQLLEVLGTLLEKNWEVELVCRCLFFLLRVHHCQIISNRVLLPTIDKIRALATRRVSEFRDMIGFNMAGMKYMMREIEIKEEVQFFFDATQKRAQTKKKQAKREKARQRAIMTV